MSQPITSALSLQGPDGGKLQMDISAAEMSIPLADSRDTGSGRFRLVSGYLAQLYS